MIKVNINGNDGSVSMSICGDLNTISAEITMIVGLVYKSIKENQGKLVADRFKENVKTTIESDTASKDDKEEFAKTIMESIRKVLRKKEDSEIVDKDIEDIVSKLYKSETDNDTGGVE